MVRPLVLMLAASLLSPRVSPAQQQHEQLGDVHFPTSCTSAAQKQFDRAMSLQHNFVFPANVQAFTDVAHIDSTCGIAYWGMAVARRANPLVGPIDSVALREGSAAAARGATTGAATERERDYIAAIGQYYRDWEHRDHKARVLAYEQAMRNIHQRYPDDHEAALFYALALDEAVTVLPADKTYARQLEAATIIKEVLAAQPRHPGALHYLIHTYDFPSLADRGLDAAARYGGVAPSASHALHMPSHVYSMMGMWQESIAANQASLNVTKTYAHAVDFMVYAHLQGAQDSAARRLVDLSAALQRSQTPDANPTGAVLAAYTAVAAIPARYVLERRAWSEAALLQPRRTNLVADGITYFVRAAGEARNNDLVRARADLDTLARIQQRLIESKQDYWAEQVGIQHEAASAWVALAEGRREDAVRQLRRAADREDASDKHVAMENRLWPMREQLGELLQGIGQPALALREYEASLGVARNRFRGLYGAASAARAAGDTSTARAYYEKLIAVSRQSDTPRPELAEASAFLARK